MTVIAKPIVRLYHMPDEDMTTRAQTMHDNLDTDIADFTAKFPGINGGFVTSFATDITTAKNFMSDTAVVNMIKVLTEDLEASVEEGMRALDALDVYAREAFDDSPAKQRVFGQDTWAKARNDQQKMVKALKLAHSFANVDPYKSALIAEGMTTGDIADLLTIAGNIDLKDGLQEKAKSGRGVTTEERIKVYNIVWAREQKISIASEYVYRDDAAKRAQYLLYPQASGESTTVTVHVSKEGEPTVGATVTLTNTALAPQITNAEGNAVFVSVNMPETVDVEVDISGTIVTLDNQAVVQGAENVIEVPVT